MKKTIITVGTNTLLQMAKQLKNRGEITEEQYQKMEERNNKLNDLQRENIVVSKEVK